MSGPLKPLSIQKISPEEVSPPGDKQGALPPFLSPLEEGGTVLPADRKPELTPFLTPTEDHIPSSGDEADVDAVSEAEMRVMQLEQMLREAKAHAEQQEQDAYNAAFAQGEKAGMALARERAEATLDQFDAMLEQARKQMLHIQRAAADAIIDIAQMLAETLIGEMREDQRAWLVHAAGKVAESMPCPPESLQLAVHPDDLVEVRKIVSEEERSWTVVSDPDLDAGCCRLVSQQQDAFIDPVHAVAELVRTIRPELQASVRQSDPISDGDAPED